MKSILIMLSFITLNSMAAEPTSTLPELKKAKIVSSDEITKMKIQARKESIRRDLQYDALVIFHAITRANPKIGDSFQKQEALIREVLPEIKDVISDYNDEAKINFLDLSFQIKNKPVLEVIAMIQKLEVKRIELDLPIESFSKMSEAFNPKDLVNGYFQSYKSKLLKAFAEANFDLGHHENFDKYLDALDFETIADLYAKTAILE